jgi:hypothetical protein
MNYKTLILTLALCLCIVPFASAAHDYYPENKIVDTNPAISVAPLDASGWVAFSILGGGAQDKTIWVVNKAVNATPFDCKFNPDKSDIAGQNPQYTKVEVPGSQNTGALQWANGEFDAYLQNGQGNQCEHISFKTNGGGVFDATQVVFQGAAVSQLGEGDGGAETERICIDVTKNVQDVVNRGHHQFSFQFDNAPNPGGIWDVAHTRLLSQITDPYYGFVKLASIQYVEDDNCYTIRKAVYGDCLPLPSYKEYRYWISEKCEEYGRNNNHCDNGYWSQWSTTHPDEKHETRTVQVESGLERTTLSL